jgi:hypothetical protein
MLRAGYLEKRTRQEFEVVVDQAFIQEMRRRRLLSLALPTATPNSFKEMLQWLAQFAVSHDLVRLDQRFPNERLAHIPEAMYHHLSLEDVMKVNQVLCRTEAPIDPVLELVGCAVSTYQKEGMTKGSISTHFADGYQYQFVFTLEDGFVKLSQVEARD